MSEAPVLDAVSNTSACRWTIMHDSCDLVLKTHAAVPTIIVTRGRVLLHFRIGVFQKAEWRPPLLRPLQG